MWWWVVPGVLLIGAAAWGTVAWLLQDLQQLPIPQQVSTRIESLRTALAAAAGVGAGVTLMLAVRRQRHLELTAAHTTHDATERRVTELYTKAAEQLGNAQAPVRLAGLYALERLAQDTPALHQTIVDVICAYLRMPYQPPAEEESDEPGVPRPTIGGVTKAVAAPRHDPREERQVRLTAQRILAEHLRFHPAAAQRWWQPRPADPNARHWADIRLDLSGATLIDFDLGKCRIEEATFNSAIFTGDAEFAGTTFTGDAKFSQVTFRNEAVFDAMIFAGDAVFIGATFLRGAELNRTTFSRAAFFNGAIFAGDADFGAAIFAGDAVFANATFRRDAVFIGATFRLGAYFHGTAFSLRARFGGATFTHNVWFRDAAFMHGASFSGAKFSLDVDFRDATGLERSKQVGARLAPADDTVRRELPPCWRAEAGEDGWQTLRLATPEELAQAEGSAAGGG